MVDINIGNETNKRRLRSRPSHFGGHRRRQLLKSLTTATRCPKQKGVALACQSMTNRPAIRATSSDCILRAMHTGKRCTAWQPLKHYSYLVRRRACKYLGVRCCPAKLRWPGLDASRHLKTCASVARWTSSSLDVEWPPPEFHLCSVSIEGILLGGTNSN